MNITSLVIGIPDLIIGLDHHPKEVDHLREGRQSQIVITTYLLVVKNRGDM
jgi:hypothetical protein